MYMRMKYNTDESLRLHILNAFYSLFHSTKTAVHLDKS